MTVKDEKFSQEKIYIKNESKINHSITKFLNEINDICENEIPGDRTLLASITFTALLSMLLSFINHVFKRGYREEIILDFIKRLKISFADQEEGEK